MSVATRKILIVDDDVKLLSAFRRTLGRKYDLTLAEGGEEAIKTLQDQGPFALIISDQQMPKMDGTAFLATAAKHHPDTVRMMLTGNADQATAARAVNEGKIFRFFSKPCKPEDLLSGIEAGLKQYQLQVAERELLEHTLAGSVKLLTDVLSLVDPDSMKRTRRMRDWGRRLAKVMKITHAWELDIAIMLHALGDITAPPEVRAKARAGKALSDDEQEILSESPEIARNLIVNIPRLKGVAEAVFYHRKGYDGTGFPPAPVCGTDIPLLARALKVIIDLDHICEDHEPTESRFDRLEAKDGQYDPTILVQARTAILGGDDVADRIGLVSSPLSWLRPGDRLAQEIRDEQGRLILSAGFELSEAVLAKLWSLKKIRKLPDVVPVYRENFGNQAQSA